MGGQRADRQARVEPDGGLVIRVGLVAATLAFADPAWAQQAADLPAAATATAVPGDAADPALSIEEQMEAFVRTGGYAEREARGEIAVLMGTAIVDVPSTNPQFIGQRSMAFQAAMVQAQSEYVLKQNVQITVQTVSDMFKAADREPPPYVATDRDPTKLAELVRKLVALRTGQIEKALKELNIDPADYERASEPQRYTQMRAALTTKTTEKAFGELVGLMPVQTFEKPIGGDAYKIGVVAIVSPRMKDLAQRVLKDRGRFDPEPARASRLSDLVADKTRLVRDFGVRWRYDDAGLPVLVSFYQWTNEYKGQDPITAERYREIAFKQAEQGADAQIALFLKGSLNVVRVSETSRQSLEAADRNPDGYVAQQAEVRKLLDGFQQTIRSDASVTITGLVTLSRWTGTHPETGAPIVGAVRMWSAAGEQAARNLRDGRPPAAAAAPSGPGAGRTGRKLMDATDF